MKQIYPLDKHNVIGTIKKRMNNVLPAFHAYRFVGVSVR